MTPAGTRRLRFGILGFAVLLSLAVALSLRRQRPAPLPTRPDAGTPASGTTMGGVVLRKFVEGVEKYVVKAQAMTGQEKGKMNLTGVEVTFPYLSQGKSYTGTVTARECVYDPDRQRAAFRGDVKVTGGDGLYVESETLDYDGEIGLIRTDDPVSFRRGALSGESRGAEYRSQQEELDLAAEVLLRIERAGTAPTVVRSASAAVRKLESAVRFVGGVKVTRGSEYLEAERLNLEMSADFEKVDRAVAIEEVTARGGAATLGGGTAPGTRLLRCRKLDVAFRENGELRDLMAVKNAELEIQPTPTGPPEVRRVQAHVLTFKFDEAGRLVSAEGGPEARLRSEAAPGGRGGRPPAGPRIVNATEFQARFDAATGDLLSADFQGGVEFSEPGRKAWARNAALDEKAGTLVLTGAPRVVDEEQGSDLKAEGSISIGTRTETLSARENVRHTVPLRSNPKDARPSPPSLFLAGFLDYDSATKTARYRENAILRSGKDELRAPLIVLEEPAAGRRRLSGSGGIVSLMYPRSEPGAAKEPLPVETRAADVVWEEEKNEAVYKGDVRVKQGDIESRSPLATVSLLPGGGVDKVVAGEPVEVQQGQRRASGARGTYTPRDETMVLVGEKVVLQDPQQRTEGRFLTFHARDDTILVDGREEVRPESVFKREPPKR